MKEKDVVEAELKALGAVLDSHKVTMTTSLISFDGYPRADIDVAQIRTTRARIIHLRNDYKHLMKRIEAGLHSYHATLADHPPTVIFPATATESSVSTSSIQTPFAKINNVAAGSPAAEAGMEKGDYIKLFGPVNAFNHEKLSKLSEVVSVHEGKPIMVLLSRKVGGVDVDREVTLTPKQWSGVGKLGCHILPL